MKEEEVINLLRHYRHDWLNDVQLIWGYASMGKTDKLEAKLRETIENANKERNLEKVAMPKTMLWMISFNWKHDNIRLDYHVETDHKLLNYDEKVCQQFINLMDAIEPFMDKMELYDGMVLFKNDASDANTTLVELSVSGKFNPVDEFRNKLVEMNELHKVKVEIISEDKYKCTLTCICN